MVWDVWSDALQTLLGGGQPSLYEGLAGARCPGEDCNEAVMISVSDTAYGSVVLTVFCQVISP
jgi:hypothetical protein